MDAVLESQEQLQALFLQKMDAFQEELKKSPPSASTSTVATEFDIFRVFILTALKGLQEQISLLAHELDNQEMRSRRKILLIHGIPEVSKEDTAAVTVKTVVAQLEVSDFSASDISRCHRMGRSSNPGRPRPILFKIRDMAIRNKLWYAKTALKGSGITLSEFLTKPRHDTFMAARQRFGVTKCWSRDGFVFVLGHDGSRCRVSCIAELNKIATPPAMATARSAKTVAKESVVAPSCVADVSKIATPSAAAKSPKAKELVVAPRTRRPVVASKK